MSDKNAILGIHTYCEYGNPRSNHAWVTIDRGGERHSYSLYSQAYRDQNTDQDAKAIESSAAYKDVDLKKEPTASLYREVTPEQADRAEAELTRPQQYDTRENNCTHYAASAHEAATGEKLNVADQKYRGVATPNALEANIRGRELQPGERVETREVEGGPDFQQHGVSREQQEPPSQRFNEQAAPPQEQRQPDAGREAAEPEREQSAAAESSAPPKFDRNAWRDSARQQSRDEVAREAHTQERSSSHEHEP